MRHSNPPGEPEQKLLFDPELGAWWHTQLSAEGVMRRSILKLVPAEKLGERFHEFPGRPRKESYAMCGSMLLAEFRDLTIDQAGSAWSFDASAQYALDLPRDRQYLRARTLDTYRQLLREDEAAQCVIEEVTAALVKEWGVEIERQRLDSTHVLSSMTKFGRPKLPAVTTKRCLTHLKRHHLGDYEALPDELRARCGVAEVRISGFGTKNPVPREEALQTVGQDMVALLERFAEVEAITARTSYKAPGLVFKEDCEVNARGRFKLTDKAIDEKGRNSCNLQNSPEDGAGFSGHKAAGYQVQFAQSCGQQDEGSAGLVVARVPQSAADSDSGAVQAVIAQQARMGTLPKEQLADTADGSEASVALRASVAVTLVAVVPGRPAAARARKPTDPEGASSPATWTQARRAEPESAQWKKRYALRSGIEGVNEALDRTTGIKALRVRGRRAVHMAISSQGHGMEHQRRRHHPTAQSSSSGPRGECPKTRARRVENILKWQFRHRKISIPAFTPSPSPPSPTVFASTLPPSMNTVTRRRHGLHPCRQTENRFCAGILLVSQWPDFRAHLNPPFRGSETRKQTPLINEPISI